MLEKINSTIRQKNGLKQWKNTDSVIDWFKKIQNKRNKKFIQFDVVNFYPSISSELMAAALEWGKKGNPDFDVGQGSYNCAVWR